MSKTVSTTVCILILCISQQGAVPTKNHLGYQPTNYKEALKLSLLFYEAQRSGHLPKSNRIQWRADSALDDRGLNGEDLTGGYYDASDYVKFSYTMAFTTTILSWGLISYRDSYENAGQYREILDAIRWSCDYFVKCHTHVFEFYGQVGDFTLDHRFWGRPEDMNMSRPAYKIDRDHPGSDLAGEVSAALSSASRVFRNVNANYSEELLRHSKELYEFATTFRGLYHEAIPGAKEYYESTGYGDELTWAAIWLYRATEQSKYLEEAESFYTNFRLTDRPNEFFYSKKIAGIQLLLAQETSHEQYVTMVTSFCDYSIDQQRRTPKGLIFVEKFGTLSHAANVAFICLQAVTLRSSHEKYLDFAKEQIDYILGAKGKSFVVGFGDDYPKRPHHASSSCPDRPQVCNWDQYKSPEPNPQILYGALVSGPDQNDHYEDIREEFLYNEVTLDYNAGFQSTLAGLIHHLSKNL